MHFRCHAAPDCGLAASPRSGSADPELLDHPQDGVVSRRVPRGSESVRKFVKKKNTSLPVVGCIGTDFSMRTVILKQLRIETYKII